MRSQTLMCAGWCALLSTLAACGGSNSGSSSNSFAFLNSAAFYVSPNGNDSNPGTSPYPFRTLAHAQAQMRISGHPKLLRVRAGTYANTAITLTSADSGETWSYYPPDGYDSAVLDGGSTAPGTGGNPITIDGAGNVTIDGLKIQNFQQWGIAIHGGEADSHGGFTNTVPSVSGITIQNNIIDTGYTTLNNLYAGGGVWVEGDCTNVTIANNVIENQYSSAIRIVPTTVALDSSNSVYTFTGLTIKNNAIFNVNIYAGDNGAIYLEDPLATTTNVLIANNFIRDYQENPSTQKNTTSLPRSVAIYLDSGASNVTVSGNVIAATANTDLLTGIYAGGTNAFYNGGGHDNTWSGNIIDMGTSSLLVPLAYDDQLNLATGNVWQQNILIGNWPGPQNSSFFGTGPASYFYADGIAAGHYPTVTSNLYYNYGGGSILSSSNQSQGADSAPITGRDPLISGTTYALATNSAAYGTLNFPPIVEAWGPPGYALPATGTAPSTP